LPSIRLGICAAIPLLLLVQACAQDSVPSQHIAEQLIAQQLITEQHYRRAEPLVRTALEKQPRDIKALIALSTIQWSYGNLDAAEATAQKAVAAADGSADAHAQLVNILGAVLASKRTGTMEKMSLSRRFRKEAERTLQLDPKNVYAHEALARYFWYAPSLAGGDKTKAMQMVAQVIQLDSTRGYTLKAELDATQDSAKVLDDWKQAVAAQPGSYLAHAGLGDCLLHAGDENRRGAEGEARKALVIDPSRIAAYRLMAVIYAETQQWQKLDAVIRQARAAVPDDPGAEFAAAQTILDRNLQAQFPLAEEYLRDYLRVPAEGLEPSTAVAHWQLGLVLEKEGRRSTALQEVQTAATLDPSLDGAKHDAKRLQ
jgi:tetratricopeptide (TPR) repeat protein